MAAAPARVATECGKTLRDKRAKASGVTAAAPGSVAEEGRGPARVGVSVTDGAALEERNSGTCSRACWSRRSRGQLRIHDLRHTFASLLLPARGVGRVRERAARTQQHPDHRGHLVNQTFASWNRIAGWLRRLNGLRDPHEPSTRRNQGAGTRGNLPPVRTPQGVLQMKLAASFVSPEPV